ncbi:alpha/beta hydrolase [Brachybacterium phenoliresistens]|uniref:Alpha/beta hydrolase n=1 Tax=Brachybacterium phenoliresistens TaxID=396014 RepID=Z9JVR1_9MICO|nr:alpha/beta fold hydrolase [Brachybacterium phenoliresistens]EWS81872.1 alpha/beta hydrolase [Brachybacterium phenoliresistens]
MSAQRILDRAGQDELLQIRNDLVTVYRPISAEDPRLFPLRYSRMPARRGAPVPVLIIPDGPAMASVLPYDPLRRTFSAAGLDVLMVEHRGVGLSRLDAQGHDLPASAMRVREAIDDLAAVLEHGKVEQAVVLGVGYGAYLALGLAALHPERVHSLVLDSPLTSADDEVVAQAELRRLYWHGEDLRTDTIAAALRRLVASGDIDGPHAGSVILAVHEYGGIGAVRDLVDLLVTGRGSLTWRSVRQVLAQDWLQSAPYVCEHDLVAHISRTSLGQGRHADGGPLDALQVSAQRTRGVPEFAGEELDLRALSAQIGVPALVLSGDLDLITPRAVAEDLVARMPRARLLPVRETGHSILDSHAAIAQIAARWSGAGAGHLLVERADELAALPRTPANRALTSGLHLALAAEQISPWRMRIQTVRHDREGASVDPHSRRARTVKM